MKKHTERKGERLKVTGIQYAPAPDADDRVSRALGILLRSAARGTTESEDDIKGKKGPAGDSLTTGEEGDPHK